DKSLLPTDLSDTEKNKINEIKRKWQDLFNVFKNQHDAIVEKQKECDDLQSKINEIDLQFPSLNSQKTTLETKKIDKNTQINLKQQEIYPLDRNHPDKKRLQDELDQLCKERQTIVNELVQIRIDIKKMESRKKMYTELLESAE
ncbi:hypothetical protein, partial sequence, partial [Candidatus Phytoplasma solani]